MTTAKIHFCYKIYSELLEVLSLTKIVFGHTLNTIILHTLISANQWPTCPSQHARELKIDCKYLSRGTGIRSLNSFSLALLVKKQIRIRHRTNFYNTSILLTYMFGYNALHTKLFSLQQHHLLKPNLVHSTCLKALREGWRVIRKQLHGQVNISGIKEPLYWRHHHLTE